MAFVVRVRFYFSKRLSFTIQLLLFVQKGYVCGCSNGTRCSRRYMHPDTKAAHEQQTNHMLIRAIYTDDCLLFM